MQTELLIIGGGPGGYVAAIKAAQCGKKVTIVEKAELGGICLNWGCIPTKALLHSARLLESIKKSSKFGIHVPLEQIKVDFPQVIQQSRNVAGRLSKGVDFLMKKNKIEVVSGIAKLVDEKHVQIQLQEGKDQIVTTEHIIIATGARPRDLSFGKIDGKRVLSSRDAMILPVLPKSIAIVGAGAIGVEFAYFFQTFGCQVTLLEMLPCILPQEDEEISKELERAFKRQNIKILTNTKIEKIEQQPEQIVLSFNNNGKNEPLITEYVLLAIGVQANTEELDLGKVGIATEKGWIKVNPYCQTNIPNIYAIGDVTGSPWLAHVASAQGNLAVSHLAGKEATPIAYDRIPACTYCHPQIASVGLTEKKAREKGYVVKTGHFPLRANGKALASGEEEGMVKMVLDAKYGEILGCHIIGSDATEMISEIALARTMEATYTELLHTIHPHPTITEAIVEATLDALGNSLHT